MRILYLSCHSILEQLEVSLFHELGHEIFSPGAYLNPQSPGDSMRPGISGLAYSDSIVSQWNELCSKHPGADGKNHLTKEFVQNFDMVIVMHVPQWIQLNWNVMENIQVIWRTIGQSIGQVETTLSPFKKYGSLKIVRYSPMERNIPGYLGEDALIRFPLSSQEYKDWTGEQKRVITFAQSMKDRGSACSFSFFEEVTRPFPRHLFGPGNEGIGEWTTGKVSFEQLKAEMRANRVYFYTGTHPASYTLNFMEAMMTGIPIVAIGAGHGNADYFHPFHDLYEVPNIIQNGVNGFISDNITELRQAIQTLFDNESIAKTISEEGRKTAVSLFDKEMIKAQWQEFLGV